MPGLLLLIKPFYIYVMYRYDRLIFTKFDIYICIMDFVYKVFIHTCSVIA